MSHECRQWAATLAERVSRHFFNNNVGTVRRIISLDIKEDVRRGYIIQTI
jgi:hypothetical protein